MAWTYEVYTGADQPPGWSEARKQQNAIEIYGFFRARGYSLNSIAGMLGNFDVESYVNPGQGEGGGGGGFGLPQYSNTAKTLFLNWCSDNSYNIYDGEAQIRWIDEQTVPNGQWFYTSSSTYKLSWAQFKVSTDTPGNLAMAFLYNWERGTPLESRRRSDAQKWYDYLSGGPIPPTPGPLKIPYWLLKKISLGGKFY